MAASLGCQPGATLSDAIILAAELDLCGCTLARLAGSDISRQSEGGSFFGSTAFAESTRRAQRKLWDSSARDFVSGSFGRDGPWLQAPRCLLRLTRLVIAEQCLEVSAVLQQCLAVLCKLSSAGHEKSVSLPATQSAHECVRLGVVALVCGRWAEGLSELDIGELESDLPTARPGYAHEDVIGYRLSDAEGARPSATWSSWF